MKAVLVLNSAEFAECLALRTAVFVIEQGVSPDAEHDDLDDFPTTIHVLVRDAGAVVGTGRLLAPSADGSPHIGRVAVAASHRRHGVGREVMVALEAAAVESYGPCVVALSAQVTAIPFYESLGYMITGAPFLDEGIWHRDANKLVDAS